MATKNDITGDALISRLPSEAYKNNYDLIFRKNKGDPIKQENSNEQQPKPEQKPE